MIIIPKWLRSRPVDSDDTEELIVLTNGGKKFSFRDITSEALQQFYKHQPRASFYKLIRILGLYGVNFSGKLANYSGPREKYPAVISVALRCWRDKISHHIVDTNLTLPLNSCGILVMKQLHGAPVDGILSLLGMHLSCEQLISSLPAQIKHAHDSFFSITPTLPVKDDSSSVDEISLLPEVPKQESIPYDSENYEEQLLSNPVEALHLSVRSSNCLKSNDINYVGDLVVKSDEELISISHLGLGAFQEIKKSLSRIGLRTGMSVEKTVEFPENPGADDGSPSVETLRLSVRSSNCLHIANIQTIAELQAKCDEELLAIRHFGRKCLTEIRAKLNTLPLVMFQVQKPSFALTTKEDEIDTTSEEILAKLKTKVSDLVLSVRSGGCLRKNNIEYMWQLVQLSEKELRELRNLGLKSKNELKGKVEDYGLKLGMHFSPEKLARISSYNEASKSISADDCLNRVIKEVGVLPLAFLKDKENLVVANRLFKEGRKQTLEEIAQNISLTRERVRQFEMSAINKIRQQYIKELRAIIDSLKQQVDAVGGLANLEGLDLDLTHVTAREQTIVSCLLQMMDEVLCIDWGHGLISTKGEDWICSIFDEIQETICPDGSDKFFAMSDLTQAAEKVIRRLGLFPEGNQRNFINKFYDEKKVSAIDACLCFGRVTKQDKLILAFKEIFPQGLDIYKKQDILMQRLRGYDYKTFDGASARSIFGRLTDHPDVLLWGRGFFIHKDHVVYDTAIARKVADWVERRFDHGHSRFQVNIPFNTFQVELQDGGVPNEYALYTLLRLQDRKRIGQRRYPTIVDLEADVDIQEGILEELENYFLEAKGPVPYPQLKEDFLVRRGWKAYSLQQNITAHSPVIYPWQDSAYIHLEYLAADYVKLEELLEALRVKLRTLQGAYSLKGAKREMNVLWEQACPSASVRTMIKLIRSVDPEDLHIERYLIQFGDSSSESVSLVADLEEFFLTTATELTKHELQEEFSSQRGWSENQLYTAIRKARLFRSGKSTFVHPSTINWNDLLSQQIHQILEAHLRERNNNQHPHMQVEELIYKYVLPELPRDIQWTRHLLKSVSEEYGDFIFFDDAYVFVDNEFDIEDLDDMIGYLIGGHFPLGIAGREKVEQMLWREGILESGRSIPSDQYFEESSIVYLENSDEVGLSPIGYERYGHSK